jgi:hypothetical protein
MEDLIIYKNLHNNRVSENVCPYIGTETDPEIRFAYPSSGNYCLKVDPIEHITFHHQEETCLTPKFRQCPVYQEYWVGPLPDEIRGDGIEINRDKVKRFWVLLAMSVIFLGAIMGLWISSMGREPAAMTVPDVASRTISASLSESDGLNGIHTITPNTGVITSPSTTLTYIPSRTSTNTPTANPSETPTPPMSPTSTQQPTNTIIPSPTPGPGIGTPFGSEQVYVIHYVYEGESLAKLSQLYDTTNEVIQAANYLHYGPSVWPEDILIIPVGQKDPALVYRFRYLTVERQTNLDDIADQYGSTAELLRQLNDLGVDDVVPEGRWLIIPTIEE